MHAHIHAFSLCVLVWSLAMPRLCFPESVLVLTDYPPSYVFSFLFFLGGGLYSEFERLAETDFVARARRVWNYCDLAELGLWLCLLAGLY